MHPGLMDTKGINKGMVVSLSRLRAGLYVVTGAHIFIVCRVIGGHAEKASWVEVTVGLDMSKVTIN